MRSGDRKNTFFVLFIISVIVLAVIYFTVPERVNFLENQIKWWREFWE